MNRSNIDKIAHTPEDKLLLAKVWDKINAGISRNIPANSCFLSQREQELVRFLFGSEEGLTFFGGFDDAERKMLLFLPEYMDESWVFQEDSPIVCLRASFYEGDSPSHRDFLGALMGSGIGRECVGDICVGKGFCDFLVTKEIAPYLLQEFESAGRTKLRLSTIALSEISVPLPETMEIRDTVASVRLDSILSSGFRIPRSEAGRCILSGRTAVNGLPCEKPDKLIEENAVISVRGLGKIKLKSIGGPTKKGRITVVIDRYV